MRAEYFFYIERREQNQYSTFKDNSTEPLRVAGRRHFSTKFGSPRFQRASRESPPTPSLHSRHAMQLHDVLLRLQITDNNKQVRNQLSRLNFSIFYELYSEPFGISNLLKIGA